MIWQNAGNEGLDEDTCPLKIRYSISPLIYFVKYYYVNKKTALCGVGGVLVFDIKFVESIVGRCESHVALTAA